MQVGHHDQPDRLRVDAARAQLRGQVLARLELGPAEARRRCRPRFSAGFDATEGCRPVSTRNGPAVGWWIRKAGIGTAHHFERGVPIPSMRSGRRSCSAPSRKRARRVHPPGEQRLDRDGRALAAARAAARSSGFGLGADLHRARNRSRIACARDGGSAARESLRPACSTGQVCVVSGAGTGLGQATRARAGAAGRDRGRLRAPAGAARGDGRRRSRRSAGSAEAEAMDIRDEEAVEALFDGVLERHGRIDVLVNNAGGQFLSPAEAISPKGFRTVIELNVIGTWLMTHAAATKAFIPQGEGKVLSVTLSPHNGMPGMVHSGAARAAVENMMRTLSIEWARFGIRSARSPPASSTPRRCAPSTRRRWSRRCPARCRSAASAPRRRWPGWSPTSPRRRATSSPAP